MSPDKTCTLCKYKQAASDPFPIATQLESHQIDHIEFTGTNFFLESDGYKAFVSYGGAMADEVIVSSDKKVKAKWNLGLPPLGTDLAPKLWFDKDGTQERYYAKVEGKIKKDLTIVGASSDLSCSFAGGCEFQIDADGLSTILHTDQNNNYISVCDERCVFKNEKSNFGQAVCNIPKMSTVYSNDKFSIQPIQEDLKFQKVFGQFEDNEMINDDNLMKMPVFKAGAPYCAWGG